MDIGEGVENVLNVMQSGIRLRSGLILDLPFMQRDRRQTEIVRRNKDPTWMGWQNIGYMSAERRF